MKNLNNIVKDFPDISIAVIGDICVDMYYFLSDEKCEVSLETGQRTKSVEDFKHEAGGAGNVAINLKSLGAGSVDIYGVIGSDPFGETLKSILTDSDVSCTHIQTQKENWQTHVYHKFYKDSVEESRCDIGNFNRVSPEVVSLLLEDIESNIKNYEVIIINEQVLHGYHNSQFQKGLADLILKYKDDSLWISDCRHLNLVYNQSIRKLNKSEAEAIFSMKEPQKSLPEKRELIQWLSSYWEKPVIITLGEDGAIGIDSEGKIEETPGISLTGPKDTVGAGDAFLAALALTMASGHTLKEALFTGNCTASVSVTKLFETGHPNKDELIRMGTSPDYRYNPEVASDNRTAKFLKDTPIEIIGLKPSGNPVAVIFDHDGTISTLRQGWEPIMKEVVLQSILGESLKLVSQEEIECISATADEMIEKTTGVQTIIQMHHLQSLVKSHSYVPRHKVLTPLEYKKIYNDRLMNMVSARISLFRRGMLDLRDVTMKGAIPFLQSLKDAGIPLYLASGTDQEDVRKEAKTLGYAELFTGGIFGSVGNIDQDPKKLVMERISRELPENVKPQNCYVFGDGPVEMREAAKRDFTGIGLLSDEKQRFGVNPDKRQRLILGGAKALIPDFSWRSFLTEYLEWNLDTKRKK
ncbi:HAD family hydrolase [Oceanispirochaeta crateris]|uniref:HAD family hydrolase n=1 Tax=Oceanispirochaeta crateris TaxID=2518645 RepID=A0A5C1QNH0_9SPIO|nr:PfkB family carbohydrate kinase [Oceanispirochaeta crateris]QEN08116.1 HAD family hydrolase [Oceanispirochaeta crateris]